MKNTGDMLADKFKKVCTSCDKCGAPCDYPDLFSLLIDSIKRIETLEGQHIKLARILSELT